MSATLPDKDIPVYKHCLLLLERHRAVGWQEYTEEENQENEHDFPAFFHESIYNTLVYIKLARKGPIILSNKSILELFRKNKTSPVDRTMEVKWPITRCRAGPFEAASVSGLSLD